jgi:hypothetical protein
VKAVTVGNVGKSKDTSLGLTTAIAWIVFLKRVKKLIALLCESISSDTTCAFCFSAFQSFDKTSRKLDAELGKRDLGSLPAYPTPSPEAIQLMPHSRPQENTNDQTPNNTLEFPNPSVPVADESTAEGLAKTAAAASAVQASTVDFTHPFEFNIGIQA